MTTAFMMLVLLGAMAEPGQEKYGKPPGLRRGRAAPPPISRKYEEPDSSLERKRRPVKPVAVTEPSPGVTVRFDPEHGTYANKGRWMEYQDGIYLAPEEDVIYIIATRGEGAEARTPNDLPAFAAEAFGTYRRYANSVCPTRVEQRLSDPVFRARVETQYERAKQTRKTIYDRDLSWDEFLQQIPDCDASGNLWRETTRFADLDFATGVKRILVRFPDSVLIRSAFGSDPGENFLPLLKNRLRAEDRIIHSPLATRQEPGS